MPTVESPLAGIRVLVTRPASQATRLAELVRDAGGEPIVVSTLIIEPVEPDTAQREQLARSDTVIFISANAAAYGYPVLRDLESNERRVIAVGRGTTRALEGMGCRDVYAPPGGQSTSGGLLESPVLRDIVGKSICIVRGQGGRDALKTGLESRGARVSYLECYRRRPPPEPETAELIQALDGERGTLVVSVTSVTGLTNLLDMTPEAYLPRLLARPLVVIGGRQRAAALGKGWTGPVLEADAGDAEIVETIAAWRNQRR